MTALTTAQLDELHSEAQSDLEDHMGTTHVDCRQLLRLIAIARAALALDEACDRGADVSVMAERLRAVRLALVGKVTP